MKMQSLARFSVLTIVSFSVAFALAVRPATSWFDDYGKVPWGYERLRLDDFWDVSEAQS